MGQTTNLLSKKAVNEYQKIFLREFGKPISYEEANSQGVRLLRLFKIIYQPLPKHLLVKELS